MATHSLLLTEKGLFVVFKLLSFVVWYLTSNLFQVLFRVLFIDFIIAVDFFRKSVAFYPKGS